MFAHMPTTLFCCFIMLRLSVGHKCRPSSCGNISKISFPFRLTNDPPHCGRSHYELTCENNTALVIYLDKHSSYKFTVQAIHYSNRTIHLNYPPSILPPGNNCSLPNHSTPADKLDKYYNTTIWASGNQTDVARFVTFVSCPYSLNNSVLLEVDSSSCDHKRNNDRNRSRYIKVGDLKASDIEDNCSIDLLLLMNPMSLPEGRSGVVSLSEIHTSLLYGFELSWYDWYYHSFFPPWVTNAIDIGHFTLQLCFLIYVLRRCCRERKQSMFGTIEDFLQTNNNLMPLRYSYKDVKRMTRNFQDKLGQGGYGSVYKGKLRSSNMVAVKLLTNPKENGKDFINEIATIGRIHHLNVVKLVGYYAGRFSNKRALLYDFMPNGSLEKYINNRQSPEPLSWERKYAIAVGVARGIQYLHTGCDIQILHFDIKPHNILLDHDFTPKISDFGLAKLCSTDDNTVTLTAPRGTIGYVAPELINRSIGGVSYKADVYSFGMLLMVMVGLNSKINRNTDEESSQYFPDWIYNRINKGKDIETGDAEIEEEDNSEKRMKRKMTIVGLWCIQMSPVDRPSMSEVLKMLESQNGDIQLPPRPTTPTQMDSYSNETWGTESSGSMAFMSCDGNATDLNKGIEMREIEFASNKGIEMREIEFASN